jgi:hypothetical protein
MTEHRPDVHQPSYARAAARVWDTRGARAPHLSGDLYRGRRLYELLQHERFWCETCGRSHPLCEHRQCRAQYVTKL